MSSGAVLRAAVFSLAASMETGRKVKEEGSADLSSVLIILHEILFTKNT